MWDEFPPEARQQLEARGVYLRPSDYGDPMPITRKLLEDGAKHLLAENRA